MTMTTTSSHLLCLPLKNNNKQKVVADSNPRRMQQAVEGQARGVRGEGGNCVGGEEQDEAHPINKAGGGLCCCLLPGLALLDI